MRFHLLFLVAMAGCATPLTELTQEAKECVDHAYSTDEFGVIGKPTQAQHDACWADVNKRLEAQAKMESRHKEHGRCPSGQILVVKGSSEACMRTDEVERIFRRIGW